MPPLMTGARHVPNTRLPKKESKAVPVWKWPVILLKYMNNNAGRESRAGHAAAQQVMD